MRFLSLFFAAAVAATLCGCMRFNAGPVEWDSTGAGWGNNCCCQPCCAPCPPCEEPLGAAPCIPEPIYRSPCATEVAQPFSPTPDFRYYARTKDNCGQPWPFNQINCDEPLGASPCGVPTPTLPSGPVMGTANYVEPWSDPTGSYVRDYPAPAPTSDLPIPNWETIELPKQHCGSGSCSDGDCLVP